VGEEERHRRRGEEKSEGRVEEWWRGREERQWRGRRKRGDGGGGGGLKKKGESWLGGRFIMGPWSARYGHLRIKCMFIVPDGLIRGGGGIVLTLAKLTDGEKSTGGEKDPLTVGGIGGRGWFQRWLGWQLLGGGRGESGLGRTNHIKNNKKKKTKI